MLGIVLCPQKLASGSQIQYKILPQGGVEGLMNIYELDYINLFPSTRYNLGVNAPFLTILFQVGEKLAG
jgi:hypothetical protein